MVKGNSRQVILVNSPDQKLFDQAIFILKEDIQSQGITDELLLKEARRIVRSSHTPRKKPQLWQFGPLWGLGGAIFMGVIWGLSKVFSLA
jgi:hypothetical protein